ncbi:MAG: hypothetical protein ACE362_24970 [Phaeodactylibacter xiamenensis]|uniref:hypothetical protein n=1 Tax=Phaeodactylibacter xiamenensis TaxID=1524460 RepID=UPI00391AEF88
MPRKLCDRLLTTHRPATLSAGHYLPRRSDCHRQPFGKARSRDRHTYSSPTAPWGYVGNLQDCPAPCAVGTACETLPPQPATLESQDCTHGNASPRRRPSTVGPGSHFLFPADKPFAESATLSCFGTAKDNLIIGLPGEG